MTIPGFDLEAWDQPVVFGVDRARELGAELERLERMRPLVLCSWRRRRSEEFRLVASGLGTTPGVFQGAEEHVPRTVVDAAWRAAREHGADAVISFGGGSTIDLGKAVSFVSEHGVEALDAVEAEPSPPTASPPRQGSPVLVHVALPTTYSGAEASGCFFISAGQQKRRFAGPGVRPAVVVADPSLTLTLPWKPTGGSGMTALANCVEALCSPSRTDWTDSVAVRAARSILGLLPILVKSPSRVMERSDMLAAAYAAGVAAGVAGKALHHVLCIGLGARTGAPHGTVSAILLPHVMRFDVEAAGEAFGLLAESLNATGPAAVIDSVESKAAGLGLPRRLREVGVFEHDLDPVAAWTTEQPDVGNNPRPVSLTDAVTILRAAW